jgi:hypothetical protein
MAIANERGTAQRIVAALGLDRVVALTLHFELNSMPMVMATFAPRDDQLAGVADAVESKKYRLVEVEDE